MHIFFYILVTYIKKKKLLSDGKSNYIFTVFFSKTHLKNLTDAILRGKDLRTQNYSTRQLTKLKI